MYTSEKVEGFSKSGWSTSQKVNLSPSKSEAGFPQKVGIFLKK
jgi:hypothetical protein